MTASAIVAYAFVRYFPSERPMATTPATFSQAPATVSTSASEVESGVKNVAAKVGPSVVSIVVSKDMPVYRTDPFGFFYEPSGTVRRKVGGGTGFFVRKDGYILTNKHVVSDPNATYTVALSNGGELEGRVLAFDPTTDLAIVRAFRKDGKPYDAAIPVEVIPRTTDLSVGSFVIAIGNALAEFQNTLTFGVVSGLGRSIEAGDQSNGTSEQLSGLVQTDTAINPGNSGGPLVNLSGKVVGINTAVTQGANGIGFAIPLSEKIVTGIVESVIKYSAIKRSFLGIRYVSLTPEVAAEAGIAKISGVLVTGDANAPAVISGSPADKAGIRKGDVISEVDGKPLSSAFGVKEALAEKFPGEKVFFKVYRKTALGSFEPTSLEVELSDR
ncbi:MAG: hypothetical protein QG650_236 [Patescibacteria group bacterium]|nr:hypothetical protein [Patescibacteria group bacterium]